MSTISWVLLAILIVLGILMAVVVWRRRRGGKSTEPNYRALFLMGAALLAVGIIYLVLCLVTDVSCVTPIPLLALGAIYLTAGLANKDKWKRNS
ncbi:hypothetical protein ACFLTS_06910 [Chloroflexota bacterium]